MDAFNKSVQFELLTGREDQYGLYVNDRWQVNDKLTVNAGLRYEYYPLMSRENRGIEQLDLPTFNVRLGGVGGNPEELNGLTPDKDLFAPRLGAAYRINDDTVLRAGYGRTFNPMPWSRPMRGFYPLTIAYTGAGPIGFIPYGTLANGIPGAPNPDVASGNVPLPSGVAMRTPEPGNIERGTIDSWNMFIERRLPGDISLSTGYVGTATNNGYADRNLNWAESGGNPNRQYFAQAGTADILSWGSRTKARYHSLQMALNRPFRNGLLLKGAYTFSKALNETDDDGYVTLLWNQDSQIDRNYARAGYDRPHMVQMGFVYELPFFRDATGVLPAILKAWQINGIGSWVSGTPFTVDGDNGLLNQQGGQQTAQVTGRARGRLRYGRPERAVVRPDASSASRATRGATRAATRSADPSNWNLDFSLFKAFPIGSRRIEFRAESTNVFNHTQWGNPVTSLTDPNFMRIRTLARNPRRIQLGLRFAF